MFFRFTDASLALVTITWISGLRRIKPPGYAAPREIALYEVGRGDVESPIG